MLENILFILTDHAVNYPTVHHLHNVALFIKNLDQVHPEVQVKYFTKKIVTLD